MKRKGQKVTLVAAMDENCGIGRNGKLPWDIKSDMGHFKALTSGEGKTVIMGRKTRESIGKDLPGRHNVIMSRDHMGGLETTATWVRNVQDALLASEDDVYVIGGAEIYEQFMPLADRLVLTQIPGTYGCDTFFPTFETKSWYVAVKTNLGNCMVHDYRPKIELEVGGKPQQKELPVSNPLNIDFGAIINTAEKRRYNLKAIGELIGHQAPVIFRELEDIRSTFEMLNERFKALDPEGKELLPVDVKTLLALAPTHLSQIENMLDMLSYSTAGWKSIAEKYGILKEAPGIKAEDKNMLRETYEAGEFLPMSLGPEVGAHLRIVWSECDGGKWIAIGPSMGGTIMRWGPNPNDAYLEYYRMVMEGKNAHDQ